MAGDSMGIQLKFLLLLCVTFYKEVHCQGAGAECEIRIKQGLVPAEDEVSLGFAITENVVVTEDENSAFLEGNMTILQDYDSNNICVMLTICKEKNGRCEVCFTHCIDNMCIYLGEDGDTTYPEMNQLTMGCPFKSGTYPVNKLYLDPSQIEINSSHEGMYRAKVDMFVTPEGSKGCDSTEKEHIATWLSAAAVEC